MGSYKKYIFFFHLLLHQDHFPTSLKAFDNLIFNHCKIFYLWLYHDLSNSLLLGIYPFLLFIFIDLLIISLGYPLKGVITEWELFQSPWYVLSNSSPFHQVRYLLHGKYSINYCWMDKCLSERSDRFILPPALFEKSLVLVGPHHDRNND